MKIAYKKDCLGHIQSYSRLLGAHLCRILRLVHLESSGQVASADSFWCRLPSPVSVKTDSVSKPRFATSHHVIKSYARNEPRVELIQRGLERALRVGGFRSNGHRLLVNGFRWRGLKQWASYGPMPASDAIGALSSQCNCDCEFCFAKTLVAPLFARSQLSLSEAATRMKYYETGTRRGLPPVTRLPLEPFSNQFSVDILKLIRDAAPDQLIIEETNGSFLTDDVLAQLAELKPIFLIVSLNGVSIDTRRNRMRETDAVSAQTAMQSPGLFRKYRIPFAISYVPWPNRSLEEIEDIVRFAESVDAARARICLPVTHRFAHPDPPFDGEEYWREIVQFVQALRPSVSIPIGTTPTIYEWQTIAPVVCGIVKDSPGARARIRYGDVIVAIEGERVITRREARNMLAARAKSGEYSSTAVTIDRDGKLIEVEIEHSRPLAHESYPYSELEPDIFPFGIELPYGIGLSDVMALQSVCQEHRGKNLLLLLPGLVFAQFRQAFSVVCDSVSFLDDVELCLAEVQSNFYGGRWFPARFWTISDIAEAVSDWKNQTGLHVDVVIIPTGAFGPGGRDMLGGTVLQLERQLDAEVRRIPMSSVVT